MRFKLPTAFLLLPLIQVAMIAQPSGVAIRILMGTSDTVSAKWDGSGKVRRADISAIEPWRFDEGDSLNGSQWTISTHLPEIFNSGSQMGPARLPVVPNGVIVRLSSGGNGVALAINTVQGNFEVRPADLTYGKSLSFLDGKVRVDLVPPFEQITNDPQGQNYCRFEGRVWVVWQAWRGGHALTDGCSQTYDVGAAPTLLEVTRDGVTIPAVAAVAKSGLLFILDRATGKPIFGAEERTVPRSDVPGEKSWPTQPFPLKPPPLARSSLTAAEGSRLDPESERFCRELLAKYPNKGPFTPFLTTGSSLFPGNLGGVNWGGLTFDQGSGLIYLAVSNVGAIGKMVPAAAGAKAPNGAPLMPYRNENAYARFVDQNQYPCNQPPWGELVAISANTADIVWRTPLGSYDELESKGVNSAGAVVLGGPISTAGGLVFIAGTNDGHFRAYDSSNGPAVVGEAGWFGRCYSDHLSKCERPAVCSNRRRRLRTYALRREAE